MTSSHQLFLYIHESISQIVSQVSASRVLVWFGFLVQCDIDIHGLFNAKAILVEQQQSSSSCCAISTDILDPFSPPFSIQHCFRQVFRAAVCRSLLVVLPLLVHVKGSIRVHHLWVRPYFSSCVPHVLFV